MLTSTQVQTVGILSEDGVYCDCCAAKRFGVEDKDEYTGCGYRLTTYSYREHNLRDLFRYDIHEETLCDDCGEEIC